MNRKDSYIGIDHYRMIKGFYENIFEISDCIRNGIFFAPVFFVLGCFIRYEKWRPSLKSCIFGALITFLLMLAEGLMLHKAGLNRRLPIRREDRTDSDMERAWIEINLTHLKHNTEILREMMAGDCKMMAVVKAQAYGHGAAVISKYLNSLGIRSFAVATIDEAIELRKNGIQGEVLILGYTPVGRAKELYRYHLTQTLIDYSYFKHLDQQGYKIKAHIKIDTGMHRLGFDSADSSKIISVLHADNLKICGIFTHLCVSQSLETEDMEFTHLQITRFYHLLDTVYAQGFSRLKTHIQSSYGLLNYPELRCDYARIGIALYGGLPGGYGKTKRSPDLYPVLSLKSRIALIREVKKGDGIGYDKAFSAPKDLKAAIIPIGYADGLPRSLSCKNGGVLLHGFYAPIIGRICMDQLAVDVTDIPDACVGDVVTFIGEDETSAVHCSEVAVNAGTIANELLSRMGGRLKIIYRHET